MDSKIRCVLLHGPSGSGKTETAKNIASPTGLKSAFKYKDATILFDHKFLAAPLVDIHTIKTETKGPNEFNRQLWMIHDTLLNVFPPLSIGFDDFIETVYDAQAWDLKIKYHEEKIVRDRDFMTGFADICHGLLENLS